MATTYTMNTGGQTARRSSDGADVPWDIAGDMDGIAGRTWVADDSPASLPAPVAPPPPVSGDAVIDALSPAQAAKCDVRDLLRLRGVPDIAMVKSKLKRIADAIGTTPAALAAAAAL